MNSEIFPILDRLIADATANSNKDSKINPENRTNAGTELYLTSAINLLACKRDIYAIKLPENAVSDAGNKFDYFKTFVQVGLDNEEIGTEEKKFFTGIEFAKPTVFNVRAVGEHSQKGLGCAIATRWNLFRIAY